jgi:tetratricopeptide (TPR) repeat protein
MPINYLSIGILFWITGTVLPVEQQIVTGDSLYWEREIDQALNYFKNIPVATNDTNFNDIQRRIQYLQQLVNDNRWGEEIVNVDWLIKSGELDSAGFIIDQILVDCEKPDIQKICFYKKAEILEFQGDTPQAINYYLFALTPDNLLKAAELAINQDRSVAREILNQIIEQYPHSVEAYIAREYLIHDGR